MPTILGTTDIAKAYLGTGDATKAYLGTTLVRDGGAPAGPLVAMWDFEGAEPQKDIVAGRTLAFSSVAVVDQGGVAALGAPVASGTATAPDGFLNQAGFTIAFWLYTPTTANTTRVAFLAGATTVAELYGGWRNLAGTIYELDRVMVVTDTGAFNRVYQPTTAGSVVPAQAWRHIVGTYDGANLVLYTNGAERSTGAKTGLVTDPDGFTIDVLTSSLVKNVGIWNRALSAAEVADLYTQGL